MAYSIGIWAMHETPDGFLYRWQLDEGRGGDGFVLLDSALEVVRPADDAGQAIGSLSMSSVTGNIEGSSENVNVPVFARVSASILKSVTTTGKAPATAHAYYG